MLRLIQQESKRGARLKRDEYSQRKQCVAENIGSESSHGSRCADSESCGEADTPRGGCVARGAAETVCQGQSDDRRAAEVSKPGLLSFITASRGKWLQDRPTPLRRKSSSRVGAALETPLRKASQDKMALTPPAMQRSRSAIWPVCANDHLLSASEAGTCMKAVLSEMAGTCMKAAPSETMECAKDSESFFPQGLTELLGRRKAAFCNNKRAEESLELCIDAPVGADAPAVLSSSELSLGLKSLWSCRTPPAALSPASPTKEDQEVAKHPANPHIQQPRDRGQTSSGPDPWANIAALIQASSGPETVGKQGVDLPPADSYLECKDDAMVPSPSSQRDSESPDSRVQRGHAALQDAQALYKEIFSDVTDLGPVPLPADCSDVEAESAQDSDYEAAEESADAAKSDFHHSDYDDASQSDSEHAVDCADSDAVGDDQDSDVSNDIAKELPAAGRRSQAAGRTSCKMPRLQDCTSRTSCRGPEGRGTKSKGLTRMGSMGSRSHADALPSIMRARTGDGAHKERRRMVSHLLKPFGRKKPSYQKGVPRQQPGTTEFFVQDEKLGCRRQTTATMDAGANPFAAISQHLQKKKRSQLAAGSEPLHRGSMFSNKMRTGLLKRRCLPESENEMSDSEYPSHQTILDSIPSPELMQLARSIDARAAACDA